MKLILAILSTITVLFVTFWKIWNKKFEEMAKKTETKADDILIDVINGIVPFLNTLIDKNGNKLEKEEKIKVAKTILEEMNLMKTEEKIKEVNESLEKKF